MNVVKCANGHFFDADTYDKCPHCGSEAASAAGKGGKVKTEHRGFSLFGQKHGSKTTSRTPVSSFQEEKVVNPVTAVPEPPKAEPAVSMVPPLLKEVKAVQSTDGIQQQKKDVTEDFWQVPSVQTPPQSGNPKKDVTVDFWQAVPSQTPVVQQPQPITATKPQTQNPIPAEDSLTKAVRAASASSEEKTMSYFSTVASAGSEATPAAQTQCNTGDPVVGWLVCIQGSCLGWSFQIGAGNNAIGRKPENRIVIPNDTKISGIRHATITYEPKRRNFYLQPGVATGLTYLNDEHITTPQKLSPRDVIELGDSKLLFVPLCGEDFSWETYL